LLGICHADQQNQNGARRNSAAHNPIQPRPGGPRSSFVCSTTGLAIQRRMSVFTAN
jgi:hypothetical protein